MSEAEVDDSTLVLSKEVYESELQWGRLVIPGRHVPFFRHMQDENGFKGDYHVGLADAGLNKGYQIGVKMTIQRPMLTELHSLYLSHKVTPGDTVIINSSSTGQLTVQIAKGQGRAQPSGAAAAPAAKRSVIDIAVNASSSFVAASTQPFSYAKPMKVGTSRSRPASRSSSFCSQGSPSSRRRSMFDREEEADADEQVEDGQIQAYRTSRGRMATTLRYGAAGHHEEAASVIATGLPRVGRQLAAIDTQAIGYSDDMEVDGGAAMEDMARFDALVNVAAGCLCS